GRRRPGTARAGAGPGRPRPVLLRLRLVGVQLPAVAVVVPEHGLLVDVHRPEQRGLSRRHGGPAAATGAVRAAAVRGVRPGRPPAALVHEGSAPGHAADTRAAAWAGSPAPGRGEREPVSRPRGGRLKALWPRRSPRPPPRPRPRGGTRRAGG